MREAGCGGGKEAWREAGRQAGRPAGWETGMKTGEAGGANLRYCCMGSESVEDLSSV